MSADDRRYAGGRRVSPPEPSGSNRRFLSPEKEPEWCIFLGELHRHLPPVGGERPDRLAGRVPAVTFGALTEAGGALFVPNTTGTFRALNARSGRTLWKTHPGAPIGGGATVAGGAALIGYGVQFGGAERAVAPPPGSRGGIVAYAVRRR